MLASSGYVSDVDQALCIGCGMCSDFCQFDAISLNDELAAVDFDKCMGCGVCAAKCEQGAIRLRREPTKGEPLDILSLQGQHK